VTGYAGASPIHPLGLYTVSTTNGRLPASIAGTWQKDAASVEAPEVAAPELPTIPDVAPPDATDPELTLPDSADAEPPTKPPKLFELPPLFEPAAPALFEPAAPALEP
jgi:hypothetical protein